MGISESAFRRLTGGKPARAKAPPALVAPAAGVRLTVVVPLKTVSGANAREHHMARHRRVKAERELIWAWMGGYAFPAWFDRSPRYVVTLTRLGGRGLDGHDNLRAALKGCADQLTVWLGLKSDADPRLVWGYGQEPGREYGVRITIEAGECS